MIDLFLLLPLILLLLSLLFTIIPYSFYTSVLLNFQGIFLIAVLSKQYKFEKLWQPNGFAFSLIK